MKLTNQKRQRAGLTKIDVLIVVVTVLLGVAVLPPLLFSRHCTATQRTRCVNNLKQVGLAFRMWADDHENQFPWQVSGTNSGTLEIATNAVISHFLVASNELNSPKLLDCPSDSARTKAVQFDTYLSATNISYFIGLEADESKPQTILSGDRNITTNGTVRSGLFLIHDPKQLQWTSSIHESAGNLGLGDGSAQQLTSRGLSKQFEMQAEVQTNSPARIILP